MRRRYASKVRQDRDLGTALVGGPTKKPTQAPSPVVDVYGFPIPACFHEAIEHERDHLSQVDALLSCMAAALSCPDGQAVQYSDVAQLARELLERSIDGLDPCVLKQRMGQVKESAPCAYGPYREPATWNRSFQAWWLSGASPLSHALRFQGCDQVPEPDSPEPKK